MGTSLSYSFVAETVHTYPCKRPSELCSCRDWNIMADGLIDHRALNCQWQAWHPSKHLRAQIRSIDHSCLKVWDLGCKLTCVTHQRLALQNQITWPPLLVMRKLWSMHSPVHSSIQNCPQEMYNLHAWCMHAGSGESSSNLWYIMVIVMCKTVLLDHIHHTGQPW